jgi:uncharacterized protein (TIGR00369 family)
VVHGGVVTTILDSVCGLACFLGLEEPQAIATLDLRIDYLKPAGVERPIFGVAELYRQTRSVAFLRTPTRMTSRMRWRSVSRPS